MLLVAGSPDASITTTNNAALLRGDSQMHAAVTVVGEGGTAEVCATGDGFSIEMGPMEGAEDTCARNASCREAVTDYSGNSRYRAPLCEVGLVRLGRLKAIHAMLRAAEM